jgi:hypothetical protein
VQSTGHTDEIQSPTADDNAVPDYRTVSPLAIVSLIVGIAAPLCLAAPLLSVIPLFGAALALVALRRIGLSDGVMIGRRAALIGLVLCVGSVCAAASYPLAVRYLRTRQAAVVGTRWIDLVLAGDTPHAFELTTASLQAPTPPEDGQASDPTSQFAATTSVQDLVELGEPAKVRLERNLTYSPGRQGDCVIEQRYLVTPTNGRADRQPMALRLKLQLGQLPGRAQWRWLIVSSDRDGRPAIDAAD